MEMRRRIGVAIFGGALIKSLTVLENVLLPLQELGSSRARNEQEWMATLLERLGLEKLRDLRPAELSRGEIQRVGLARALILDPEILICDDIFSGLDWRTRQRLVEFLEELQKSSNLTVVVCTSLPEIGLKAADRMIVLEEGRCVASGTSAEIKQLDDPIIERVLLSHIEAMQSFGAFASATNSGERP